MHTHYDNLKVTRGAPAEVIRAAYKALSQRYHPDKNTSPDAQRIMRIINEAYAVLGDPERRKAYDRELSAHEQQAPKVQGPPPDAAPAYPSPRERNGRAEPSFAASARASTFNQRRHTAPEAAASQQGKTKESARARAFRIVVCVAIVLAAAWTGWHANHRLPVHRTIASAAPHANVAARWTNPVTGASVQIDGVWTLSVTRTENGEPIYTFTDPTGRAAVVFAREVLPDVGFSRYIPAYLRNNASTMPLGVPGTRDTVDGHESWIAEGRLKSDPTMKTHVELRHIDASFWRIVTVQGQPYENTDEATGKLKQQLWSTLAGL
jgi:DnaJ domain